MAPKNDFVSSKNKPLSQRADSLIAAELLLLDIDNLVAKITEIHPEPFAVISQQKFNQQVALIKQSIRYPLTRNEFYLRIAPLVASLSDIHSNIKLPKLSQKLSSSGLSLNSVERLFPLAVLFENSGLYVAADLSSVPQIPTGAIITSVNGASIEFLLKVMSGLVVKETDAGQRRRIQVDFPWLLIAMGYGSEQYAIEYLWQGKPFSKNISGLLPPSKNIVITNELTEKKDELITQSNSVKSFYGFSLLTKNTAMLWFNDFNEEPRIFKRYIDRKFELFNKQGINNLIIDVRYNDGGLSQNIKVLLSHISDKSVYWSQRGEIKISRPLTKLHKKKTKQRRKNKYKWGLQWLPLEWTDSLQYKISWADKGEKLTVKFDSIEGKKQSSLKKITVLTNGFCYSACSSFVATVNHYSLAETFGETVGSFAKVQYGYPIQVMLPHSQLGLMLPTMKLMFSHDERNRKKIMQEEHPLIEPTRAITRNVEQIIERQDVVSNTAILEVESRNK